MRLVAFCVVIAMTACDPAGAGPDAVTKWNEQAIAIAGPTIHRTLAMMHIAMFDAVNALSPRYRAYLSLPSPPEAASTEAAASAAAYGVLVRLFPARRQTLDNILVDTLVAVSDGPSKTQGLRYGDLVAQMICHARASDHMTTSGPLFMASAAPGRYQLTIPGPSQPVYTNASNWKPFALRSASQFRPDGPPTLTSATYARDLAEVRRVGGSTDAERTLAQEEIARWHSEPVPHQLNRLARDEAALDRRGLLEHARLFALLNLALADTLTSVFEAKYVFLFWRPVTAIRHADNDGNSETSQDASWSPFLLTPPHPEFPSAHSALQAAGARVMTAYFGDSYTFQTTSSIVPGLTRSYDSFSALVEEGAYSQILGGTNFRSAVETGVQQGKNVANWLLERYLVPLGQH